MKKQQFLTQGPLQRMLGDSAFVWVLKKIKIPKCANDFVKSSWLLNKVLKSLKNWTLKNLE